jgi:hypothetical protein
MQIAAFERAQLVNADLGGVGDFLEAAVPQFAASEKACAELRRSDARSRAADRLGSVRTARFNGEHRCGLVSHLGLKKPA